jgi:hypothetical protein
LALVKPPAVSLQAVCCARDAALFRRASG